MRTLMLLVLTVVAVSGLTQKEKGKYLLKTIISEVDRIQNRSSETKLHQFVKDVFPNAGCSAKHLCQAATVMMNTNLNFTKLHRQLSAYANNSRQHNCSVGASQHDITMSVFLRKVKRCCRSLNSEA